MLEALRIFKEHSKQLKQNYKLFQTKQEKSRILEQDFYSTKSQRNATGLTKHQVNSRSFI